MRFLLICILATILPAVSVLGQRGGRGGGRGGFNRPGGNSPNTFVTVASARPAPTQGAGANPAAAPNNAPAGGSGAGTVQASLIPPFGITAGVRSCDGTANCVGDNNVNIP